MQAGILCGLGTCATSMRPNRLANCLPLGDSTGRQESWGPRLQEFSSIKVIRLMLGRPRPRKPRSSPHLGRENGRPPKKFSRSHTPCAARNPSQTCRARQGTIESHRASGGRGLPGTRGNFPECSLWSGLPCLVCTRPTLKFWCFAQLNCGSNRQNRQRAAILIPLPYASFSRIRTWRVEFRASGMQANTSPLMQERHIYVR